MIDGVTTEDVIEFYKTHSTTDTTKQFKITRSTWSKILLKNNIKEHTVEENYSLSYSYRKDCRKEAHEEKIKSIISSIDKDTLSNYYYSHGARKTCEYFKIGRTMLNKILTYYDIRKMSNG